MINIITVTLLIGLSLMAMFVKPLIAAAILSLLFIFLAIKIFKNQCRLLLDKEDCQIWDMACIEKMEMWEDSTWDGTRNTAKSRIDAK